jgi:dTDP-4-dehydrorhamnose reductase
MKVMVLGATGMLGNAVFRLFADSPGIDVYGTARSSVSRLRADLRGRVISGIDVGHFDDLSRAFAEVRPEVVVNCIGLVKQLAEADDPLVAVPLNSLLPHRLARLCRLANARLVHVSTDCVFSGTKGRYTEADQPDARDLYGLSKLLGEVDYPNAVTLRTSIIGHELASAHGLVEWFLSQSGGVRGFTRAVFSGLPTVELAAVIRDRVLGATTLRGVYHVSAEPIAKFDLLALVARQYGRSTEIVPDERVVIDRSLDGSRFSAATGYVAPPWPELVRRMHAFG